MTLNAASTTREHPRSITGQLGAAGGVITDAVDEHRPSHVFALFSGGHDSLCSTAVAALHPSFTAAVHINTGVGMRRPASSSGRRAGRRAGRSSNTSRTRKPTPTWWLRRGCRAARRRTTRRITG
jgi:hypothetical protein